MDEWVGWRMDNHVNEIAFGSLIYLPDFLSTLSDFREVI